MFFIAESVSAWTFFVKSPVLPVRCAAQDGGGGRARGA